MVGGCDDFLHGAAGGRGDEEHALAAAPDVAHAVGGGSGGNDAAGERVVADECLGQGPLYALGGLGVLEHEHHGDWQILYTLVRKTRALWWCCSSSPAPMA